MREQDIFNPRTRRKKSRRDARQADEIDAVSAN